MNKTHWKKLTNPNYLGAWDFQPGEVRTLTIREVKEEPVKTERGTEQCEIVYFMEDVKPLILNKTNGKMISQVWGSPYIEDWVEKQIKLYVKKVSAFGETVDAVRVLNERPENAEICEKCGKPIEFAAGHSAQEIINMGLKKFEKKLCINCLKEENKNA